MGWVPSHLDEIWSLTLSHLAVTVPAIVLGFLISVPLGYWASRSGAARSVLLTTANVFYTIPGVALVVLVPVALGLNILDPTNVTVALTIYAVAIMLRFATDAFGSVPDEARQSSVAQGFSGGQRFWRVELPLAGPVLLAGIRVVSVSSTSLATVGAFVGIQTLGTLFTDAYQRSIPEEALSGIVAVVVLAAVLDLLLTLIGRGLMPWSRGSGEVRGRTRARLEAVPTHHAGQVL